MRTQQEILDRIKHLKENDNDLFGFQTNDLLLALDYENVKSYFKEDSKITKEEWVSKKTVDLKKCMIEYMDFAWEKANNCRGLSAGRSLEHYISWLWLDGDEKLHLTLRDYEYYGKPQLRLICEYLSLNPDDYDDGVRVNNESERDEQGEYIPDGYEIVEINPKISDKKKNEPKDPNEPETLCIAWLSSCQNFSFMKDIKEILSNMPFTNKKKLPHNKIFDSLRPIVGAIAVKYPNNHFSVFIGIAMGQNEEKDIAYIKRMGQRTTEGIARGIFPQFADMEYHN